jgi:nucleoside-diphosphate-sugar epimerase
VPLIGKGGNPLSAIYVGCVAEAALLAASDPGSVGEAYNITDQGAITQRDYLNLWAEACGARPIRARRSYPVVFAVASLLEAFARFRRQPKPPFITRYATWLMGRELAYSTAKARERLGWSPSLDYRESIERTVRWYLGQAEANPIARGTLKAG